MALVFQPNVFQHNVFTLIGLVSPDWVKDEEPTSAWIVDEEPDTIWAQDEEPVGLLGLGWGLDTWGLSPWGGIATGSPWLTIEEATRAWASNEEATTTWT